MSALDRFKKLTIIVGIPSHGVWTSDYGMCLQNMMSYAQSKPIGNFKTHTLIPFHTKGSILPRARLNIVKASRERGATHILFTDVDQTFPRDTLHRLVLADKDIVGCNVATKSIPASPTARKKGATYSGELVYTDAPGMGIPQYEKVWRLGTGIMLVRTKVFDVLGLNCWEILWKEEIQDYQGEDWYFCEKAQQHGFDIWVDHHLSNEIGHIGEYNYKHDVVGEIRKEVVNG